MSSSNSESFDDVLAPADPIPNFPAVLKTQKIWLTWKAEKDPKTGKVNKIPFNPLNGRRTSDIAQAVDFETAVANLKGYTGLGVYVDGGLVCVDLDNCIDLTKPALDAEMQEILSRLDSYTEVSQSGNGIHVFVAGTKPGTKCRVPGVEIYDSKRFIAVTGRRVDGVSHDVEPRDITWLYEKYLGETPSEVPTSTESKPEPASKPSVQVESSGTVLTSKMQLFQAGAIVSTKPFIVEDEYRNRVEYPSQSEADQAFCNLLAFELKGDAEAIDTAYRESSLMREKWNRNDYRNTTIKSAIECYEKSEEKKVPPSQRVPGDWRSAFMRMGDLQTGGVQMLIDNFLPEGLSMIGALPGNCKTLFALSLSRALTTGKDFLGRFKVREPIHVLYLTPESSGAAFRKRCEQFSIPHSEMFLCRTISQGATLLMDDSAVKEAVTHLKPLVILDTAIRFNQSADENSASANKKFVNDAAALISAGAKGVLGLHHATKSSRKDGLTLESALRGTGDLAAMCDCVYGLKRNDALYEDGRGPVEIEVVCLKPRDFDPPPPFSIAASVKVDDKILSHIDSKGDFVFLDPGEVIDDLSERFIKIATAEPDISMAEIAEKLGVEKYRVQRIAKKAGYRKSKSGWVFTSVKVAFSTDPKTSEEIAG